MKAQDTEKHLMDIYNKLKKDLPGLHRLTFEIDTYSHSGKTKMNGWYHFGNNCEQWHSIEELIALAESVRARRMRKEILFRNFGPTTSKDQITALNEKYKEQF